MTDAHSVSMNTASMELPIGIASWMTCSVGMLLFNKLAVTAFPLECFLIGMQMFVGAMAMVCCCWRSIHIGSAKDVMRWMMVAPFFTGMLLSSILALKHAPMTLVITFRAISPLVSLAIERFYPRPIAITPYMCASIVAMIVGVCVYAKDLDKSELTGIGWVILNNFFAIGDRLLQRLMLAKDQSPVDISLTGVTLLNNVLGMIPLMGVAFILNEFHQVPAAAAALDAWGIFFVAASCAVGVGISYTGVWVQSLISATSFLVLVNANKFVIIGIEAFIMKTKVLSAAQMLGASITIFAGVAYGKAREQAEKESAKEKEPLVGKP